MKALVIHYLCMKKSKMNYLDSLGRLASQVTLLSERLVHRRTTNKNKQQII